MKPRASALFFCESCGTEVNGAASICPSCGSVFTAVRCPKCAYEGKAPEFRSGCPVCGYRSRSREPPSTERAGGSARKLGMRPGFYRAAVVVLAALILGLLVFLVLKA
ncbi:MAG: hypothetical protein ABSG21_01710 [Spirochaetia bacterium]